MGLDILGTADATKNAKNRKKRWQIQQKIFQRKRLPAKRCHSKKDASIKMPQKRCHNKKDAIIKDMAQWKSCQKKRWHKKDVTIKKRP